MCRFALVDLSILISPGLTALWLSNMENRGEFGEEWRFWAQQIFSKTRINSTKTESIASVNRLERVLLETEMATVEYNGRRKRDEGRKCNGPNMYKRIFRSASKLNRRGRLDRLCSCLYKPSNKTWDYVYGIWCKCLETAVIRTSLFATSGWIPRF